MVGLNLRKSVEGLQLLADPTRMRLLCLLEEHELSVGEITSILDMAQSRVSTHLGRLREAGWLCDRRAGASTFYRLHPAPLEASGRELWLSLRGQLDDNVLAGDLERCQAVLRSRNGALTWPEAVAGQMERHYSPGRTWEATLRGMIGFIQLGDVLDIGCGDGALAQLLAPRCRSYLGLDRSERIVSAARKRLTGYEGVEFRVADMHALPFEAPRFDSVLLFNTLTYAETPRRVVSEALRVLRDDGRLALITLAAHSQREVAAAFQHVQLGFKPSQLRRWLVEAGAEVEYCTVACRERQAPHFEIVTALARRPRKT